MTMTSRRISQPLSRPGRSRVDYVQQLLPFLPVLYKMTSYLTRRVKETHAPPHRAFGSNCFSAHEVGTNITTQ
jgi:hypothetical protein